MVLFGGQEKALKYWRKIHSSFNSSLYTLKNQIDAYGKIAGAAINDIQNDPQKVANQMSKSIKQ